LKLKRKLAAAALVAGAGIAAVSLGRPASKNEPVPASGRPSTVRRATVRNGIALVGELQAASSVGVASRIPGTDIRLLWIVGDGSLVRKGDLLARVDASGLKQALEENRVALARARVSLEAVQSAARSEETQAIQRVDAAKSKAESERLKRDKVYFGEGPLEIGRLEKEWREATGEAQRWAGYVRDLEALLERKIDVARELESARRKRDEIAEKEALSRQRLGSYKDYVFPGLTKEAELSVTRAELDRDAEVKSAGYAVAKAQAEAKRAEYDVKSLEEKTKRLEETIVLGEIVAPADGLVVLRESRVGGLVRKVQAGDQVFEGMPLLDLPDTHAIVVSVRVREIDLPRIREKQAALVRVEAAPSREYKGSLGHLGVLALPEPGETEKYFSATVSIEEKVEGLRPGMTAQVLLVTEERRDVLAVSRDFLRRADNGEWKALRQRLFGLREVSVETGLEGIDLVEVRSGLGPGDQVLPWP
jgi:multidrug resistance efflux pump